MRRPQSVTYKDGGGSGRAGQIVRSNKRFREDFEYDKPNQGYTTDYVGFAQRSSRKSAKKEITDGYTEYFSVGCDFSGQLGHGAEPKKHDRSKFICVPKSLSFDILIKQVSCGAEHTLILSKKGELFSIGSNEYGQLGLNDKGLEFTTAPLLVQETQNRGLNIKSVSCGMNHCALLTY